ncbi:hypothetical protein ACGFI3_44900 [Nonomuraea wenchangensis]|uniref:hypothetical protein n=1 Tax=Nonomuraea wenchangensis TaxID=568860 RepID=UPI0037124073
MVEAHQLGGAFGGDAELGPEAGPQAFAAPADLVRQAVDPHPTPAGEHPPPGVGDFRMNRRAGAQPSAEDIRHDREPFVPRCSGAQLVLGLLGVAAPGSLKGYQRPGELGRCAEHRGRRHRLEPDLEALPDPSAGCSKITREEPDDDTAALASAVDVVDDAFSVAQIDEQGDGRVRDHGDVDERGGTMMEPGHADPRQPT